MRKYLIVVRAGEKSLHTKWLGSERNWDLVVSYYGDEPTLYVNDEYLRVACKGSKFIGLSDFFRSSEFNWKNYDYIWCPDDDLDASCHGINQFFEICELIGAELAQPALDWSSFYTWGITLRNTSFNYRATNFVEIMAPCFSRTFLETVLPTFMENRSGWGLEWLWQLQLDRPFRSYIVDATPIRHTRPVGSGSRGLGEAISPDAELNALLKRKGLQASFFNFGGRLKNGRWIDVDSNKYEFIYRTKEGQFNKGRPFGLKRALKSSPQLFALLCVTRALILRRLPVDIMAA
jgi:hypothetical protein